MVQRLASGQLGRIIYAQLEPDEDVYQAIMETAEKEGIRTGLVLNITGALAHTRLSMPRPGETSDQPPGIFEMAGTAEASGSGYIGRTAQTWESPSSGIRHVKGEPFMHVHLSVSGDGSGHTGHLIEGCRVRSLHPRSHFVIVLAEVHGIDLTFHSSETRTEKYPQGLPYYDLNQL